MSEAGGTSSSESSLSKVTSWMPGSFLTVARRGACVVEVRDTPGVSNTVVVAISDSVTPMALYFLGSKNQTLPSSMRKDT